MTAPSLISVTATSYSTTGVLSKATASISVTAGDILVAKAAMESGWNTGSAADVNITVSDSAGNTWTRKQELAHTGASADDTVSYVTAWTAVAAATGSTTVTFAQAGATNTAKHFGGEVDVWRGSNGVGATNVANNGTGSGAPSVSITTTQDNSALSGIVADWNATTGTDTWTTTAGTPINRSDFSDGASYGVHTATYADVGATGSKTVGMSAPATQRYGIIVVEIKGAAAATTVVGMPRGGRLFAPRSGPTRGLQPTRAFPTGTVYADSVTEAATAADAVSVVAVFAASDTEAGTATDTVAATAVFAASVSEAAAATDAPSATAVLNDSVTEAGSATDTVTSGQIFTADLTEAATATDTDSTTTIFAAADAEAATASDAPSATAVFGAAVTEAGAATDTPAAVAIFPVTLSEAATATDATDGTTQTVYNVSITEAANATDSLDGDGGTPLRLGGGPALWFEPKSKPRKPAKRTLDDILAEIIERADENKAAIPQAAAAVTDEVIEDGELDELREEIERTLKERRKRGDVRRLKIVAAIAAQRAIRRRMDDDDETAMLLLLH
jgi:hypothetical protein